jgi:hypothetical protein
LLENTAVAAHRSIVVRPGTQAASREGMKTEPAKPLEQPLIPAHWPDGAKIIVLWAALWFITASLFFLAFLLDRLLGGILRS